MRPGLVILDGPDACGKTTLAKELLKGDMTGYVHLTYDKNWADPNLTLWKLQWTSLVKAAIRLGQGKLTVIDRHWMSEQIYARVYRQGSSLTAECRMWDRVVQRLCGVYVICAPQVESATRRHAKMHDERSEMYEPSPSIQEIARKYLLLYFGNDGNCDNDYAGFLSRSGGLQLRDDCCHYDLDHDGNRLDWVVKTIMERVEKRIRTQYPPALTYTYGNYLGHPSNAKYLFVGERINPNKRGPWPFVDYGASSATLSNALHRLDFDETTALWTNAFADDQHAKLLSRLYPRLRVFAFGEAASIYLEENDVQHSRIVHPAFAKRFGKTDDLETQLKVAMQGEDE